MLDFEHAPLPPDTAGDIALAAIRAGLTPVARPRSHDPAEIGSLLTMGALAILAPHVDTPAQAQAVAAACRFPPRGTLGVPGAMPHFGYGLSLKDACDRFDAEVAVIAMIESRQALANAPAIAATPGIDALFIGASDLLWEAGHPGDYAGPVLAGAVAQTAAAARAAGKPCGMGGPRDPALWPGFLDAGMRMILTENDLSLLLRGARDRATFFDDALAHATR